MLKTLKENFNTVTVRKILEARPLVSHKASHSRFWILDRLCSTKMCFFPGEYPQRIKEMLSFLFVFADRNLTITQSGHRSVHKRIGQKT